MPTPQLTIEEIKTRMMKFARKELVFGCEIELKKKRGIAFIFHNGKALIKGENVFFLKDSFGKILGSPLLLNDILKAMEKKDYTFKLKISDGIAYLAIFSPPKIDTVSHFDWNLSEPTFNLQREETQRQIHAILFPNQE